MSYFVSGTKRVCLVRLFSAKRVHLQHQKRLRPEPNVLVFDRECARLQRQNCSFPTQKGYIRVLYQGRMLSTLSIQCQNIFGKNFIPDQLIQNHWKQEIFWVWPYIHSTGNTNKPRLPVSIAFSVHTRQNQQFHSLQINNSAAMN